MKINNTIKLVAKNLIALAMLSQLAACNFMTAATGVVGDVKHTGANNFDTEVIAEEADNVADTNIITDEVEIIASEVDNVALKKTLNWVAPSAREDGSPLSMAEIAGFRIYYGVTQGEYQQYVEIEDAYIDEIDLNNINLQSDTYYMVMTTIDTSGNESAYSKEIIIEA